MSSLINKKAVKEYILKKTAANRPGWDCCRVSAKVLSEMDAFLRAKIEESVHRHPTVGKTYVQF